MVQLSVDYCIIAMPHAFNKFYQYNTKFNIVQEKTTSSKTHQLIKLAEISVNYYSILLIITPVIHEIRNPFCSNNLKRAKLLHS